MHRRRPEGSADAVHDGWRRGPGRLLRVNVDLLGQVLKKEDRASEIISGIEGILSDLRGISGTSDQNVYIAGVTISGSNTLNTTFPVYIPFDLTGTSNAYQGSTENKVVLRVEAFTTMDIDMMIVDPSSSDKVGEADSQYLMEYVYLHGLDRFIVFR